MKYPLKYPMDIPTPRLSHLSASEEVLIALGLNQARALLPEGEAPLAEVLDLLPPAARAVHGLLSTGGIERVARLEDRLVRDPLPEQSGAPFALCSPFEASMWSYLSLTWGMPFTVGLFDSLYAGRMFRTYTCPECGDEHVDYADSPSTSGFCSTMCEDYDYDRRHAPEPDDDCPSPETVYPL